MFWVGLAPIGVTLLTNAFYGVVWGSRTESRLSAVVTAVADLDKRMDLMDRAGTRPVQLIESRLIRVEEGERSIDQRLEAFRKEVTDLKTPLALRVEALERMFAELTLKVNARLMDLRR